MSINGITVGGNSREGAKDGDVTVEEGNSKAAAVPGPVFQSLRKMLAAGVHLCIILTPILCIYQYEITWCDLAKTGGPDEVEARVFCPFR